MLPTFAFNANGSQGAYDQSAGSGTVTVATASPAVTFSSSQSGLAGQYIVIAGDTSNGLYLVSGGSGFNWVLASPFGGSPMSGPRGHGDGQQRRTRSGCRRAILSTWRTTTC